MIENSRISLNRIICPSLELEDFFKLTAGRRPQAAGARPGRHVQGAPQGEVVLRLGYITC